MAVILSGVGVGVGCELKKWKALVYQFFCLKDDPRLAEIVQLFSAI